MREGEGHGRKTTSTTNPSDLALTGGIEHQISHIQGGRTVTSVPFRSIHLSVTPPTPLFSFSSACVTYHQAPREIHLLLPPTKVGGARRLRCGGAFEYRVRTGTPPPHLFHTNVRGPCFVVGTFKLHNGLKWELFHRL